MKLYFARHAESEANIKHIISNRGLPHPLTERGRTQAEDLAKKLKHREPFRNFLQSDPKSS